MKIIIAVDGSKCSEWAVDLLLRLPLAKAPQVIVIHVVTRKDHIPPFIESVFDKEYKDAMQKKIKKDLDAAGRLTIRIVDKLKVRWNDIRLVIEQGHVSDRIIEKAREENADLIILGSRGLSGIKNILLGGVSHKVVTYANCAVLVVKRKIRNFKKVLIAVDGSHYSEAAVSFLKSHFLPETVGITVINVWDNPFKPPRLPVDAIEKKYTRAMFQGVFEAQALCVNGDPAEMIANTARQKKVDLVIVGSKGLTGIKQFFLGSVARKLITYGIRSVLVVKTN